jgi:hypothetical protein
MYSIRFSKLSEAQYARSVLPRRPSVLIGLTGTLVVIFSLRAAYEVLAASAVWALPAFPPLRWSHAGFFLVFDLAPVLISLSLTARIPHQSVAQLWDAEQSGVLNNGWESPAVSMEHAAAALVQAQLLQPLTGSAEMSPTSERSGRPGGLMKDGAHGSMQSNGSRGAKARAAGSHPVDYGMLASLYGSSAALHPYPAHTALSAPGVSSGLLASLAMPRVSSRESLLSTNSAGSVDETRFMLPSSYQPPPQAHEGLRHIVLAVLQCYDGHWV